MAYDEKLAERIRNVLGKKRKAVVEKKMFGGVAFMIDDKMVVGIMKDELMARVGADDHEKAIAKPHAHTMEFTGRPMKGFVLVRPVGIKTDAALTKWIDQAAAYVATVPARKKPAKGKPKK